MTNKIRTAVKSDGYFIEKDSWVLSSGETVISYSYYHQETPVKKIILNSKKANIYAASHRVHRGAQLSLYYRAIQQRINPNQQSLKAPLFTATKTKKANI